MVAAELPQIMERSFNYLKSFAHLKAMIQRITTTLTCGFVLTFIREAMLVPICWCLDLICVFALRQILQILSHARIISCLPGLNQYKAKDKVSSSGTQRDL